MSGLSYCYIVIILVKESITITKEFSEFTGRYFFSSTLEVQVRIYCREDFNTKNHPSLQFSICQGNLFTRDNTVQMLQWFLCVAIQANDNSNILLLQIAALLVFCESYQSIISLLGLDYFSTVSWEWSGFLLIVSLFSSQL